MKINFKIVIFLDKSPLKKIIKRKCSESSYILFYLHIYLFSRSQISELLHFRKDTSEYKHWGVKLISNESNGKSFQERHIMMSW